jgi:hypothetical protein
MKALPLDVRQLDVSDDIKKKFRAAFSIHICSSGQTDFCIKVDYIKRNQGKKEFVFRIDDIIKPYQEGSFGLEGWKRPYLDELLKRIQDDFYAKTGLNVA